MRAVRFTARQSIQPQAVDARRTTHTQAAIPATQPHQHIPPPTYSRVADAGAAAGPVGVVFVRLEWVARVGVEAVVESFHGRRDSGEQPGREDGHRHQRRLVHRHQQAALTTTAVTIGTQSTRSSRPHTG